MQALALYRRLPLAVRLHTRIRAFTCPMEAAVSRAPSSGRLLEVGCGHGLFANEAALHHPTLHVLGVDPAEEKIRWAEMAALGRPNVAFRCARIDAVSERDFDAVAILDVLYLVPRPGWPEFLRACLERLRPGGRLVLKEVDVRPRWKFYRCVLQEKVSVGLLGVTMAPGDAFAFAGREEMSSVLEDTGFRNVGVTDLGRGYLTPHVLYQGIRP